MMDFKLTDEQELFVAGVRELMERENWEAYFAKCDEAHEYPIKWVKELAELGVDTMLLPEEHGGMDASWVTLAAIWEELGRCGAPTYVLYQLPGFSTILKYGSQEQIDKIFGQVTQDGLTLVVLALYLNDKNIVKARLALAKGKNLHDKRETIKRKEADKEARAAMKKYV